MKAPAAVVVIMLSSLATGAEVRVRQSVNICQTVQTQNGCIQSASFSSPIFFTCVNGQQTLFTCDGGCRQENAANLPTCDNGKLFNGMID
ncbi:hypothetical protein DHEL01_v209281 [Diaporthe helianthi]|uniref:Uncharacterized protein n=1 Tax=Diaporthe helianthi TaxID=158607 RepID=A0A2P5HPY7_DIAHE|nr:hypothetical protein DHEL01_v209281 [Diaporthe helianthi]